MLPKRIISVVPSQTELLFDLGLDEEVVGITKFCIHPNQWFRNKQRVGGTKNLNIDLIHTLKPDLIVANKEENTQEQILELQNYYEVYVSDIVSLNDAFGMIQNVGKLVGKTKIANEIVEQITNEKTINKLQIQSVSCAYLIWKNPYMFAGKDTFINDMMQHAGCHNVVYNSRYPMLTLDELANLNPQIVMLSSEPFPFKDKDIEEVKKHLPNANVILVDGELFSWYGSRLIQSFKYFKSIRNNFY